jgi:hypothetical protein
VPANVAFLSDRLTADHIPALNRAQFLIEWDKAWRACLSRWVCAAPTASSTWRSMTGARHIGPFVEKTSPTRSTPAASSTPRRRDASSPSGWRSTARCSTTGREEGDVRAPPFPHPDALLPPPIEESLVAMHADQMIEKAYDDYFAELVDQDDDE